MPGSTLAITGALRRNLYRVWLYGQWALFLSLGFLMALYIAWHILAKMDFLYPLWYETLGIDRVIAVYGPRNRYRRHFETTTKTERIRLFSAIVQAIHRQGKGLETLVYTDPDGRPVKLLRPAEILHLQDVSRLLDGLLKVGMGASLGWLVLVGLLRWRRVELPSNKVLMAIALVLLGTAGGIVLLLGPVEVFYGLHTRVFPAGHPWFFYYQDSLMTTLLKAPVIFGYIALVLSASSLVILAGLLFICKSLYRYC